MVVTVKNLRNANKRDFNIKKLCKKDHSLYNKRIINENSFSWIKQYGILNHIYEKSIKSYRGLLLLALSYIVYYKHQNIINAQKLTDDEKRKQLELRQHKNKQRRIKRRLDKKERERENDERKRNRILKIRANNISTKTLYETQFGNKKCYLIVEK